ncbi:MAG: DinB family protein [Nocardioides sp.]|nr:DinB family protein [Nocardioides sp.]
MTTPDPKATLIEVLQQARDAMVWKLDGLDDYDVRRPLTPTGTNLLGLVKHLASVELGYFGDTFGRPHGEDLPWYADDADANDDLWVTPEETRDDIVGLYRRAWAHAAGTFESLDLDSEGRVPHWPAERERVTLHQILVHMTAETHRHAGHADIVRELIDGAAGRRPDDPNLADGYDWAAHRARIEAAARTFD